MCDLSKQDDEVCLLMRRSDKMPVYEMGDIESLLGISLARLQEDIASLEPCLHDRKSGRNIWRDYLAWDGKETDDRRIPHAERRVDHCARYAKRHKRIRLFRFSQKRLKCTAAYRAMKSA